MAVLCAAIVLLAGLTACGGEDGPAPAGGYAAHAAAVARVVPVEGTRFGAWVRPRGGSASPAAKQTAVEQLEARLGHRLEVVGDFAAFDEGFPDAFDRWVVAGGRTLLVSWNGTTASSILSGGHDDLVRARARALAGLGAPVLLRFWWEMDTPAKARWGSPQQYVAAWRHVRSLFAAEGADNVVWVWAPTAAAFADGRASRWYPGRPWVDLAGADGYDFAPVRPGAEHRSVAEVFTPFARWARGAGLPAIIPEIGAVEDGPGDKGRWIASIGPALAGPLRGVGTLVWFDSRRSQEGSTFDWRLDSSPSSLAAARSLARDLGDGLVMPAR